MRLSLDPAESESIRATSGIDPVAITFFKGIDDHHRLLVVATEVGGYHWVIMGPVGVLRMQKDPARVLAVAILKGQQAREDFMRENDKPEVAE